MNILLLATTSTAAPVTTTEIVEQLRIERPELFTVPPAPAWSEGLPRSLHTPGMAQCVSKSGRILTRGIWLPHRLGREVEYRLMALEAYPARAQAVVDALAPGILDAIADRAAAEPPPGYPLRTLAVWIVGAAAAGLVVGAVAF
jgi:hypothetical protein